MNVDPARSAQMALIRSKNTKPELRIRKALHAAGLRFRLHDRRLPGAPDLSFPSRRIVVFIHGCFWHQHEGCKAARLPKSRQDFWVPKLQGNVERDKRKKLLLENMGWTVETIWECQTRKADDIHALASRIQSAPRRVRSVKTETER